MKPSVWMAVPIDLRETGPRAFYTRSERLAIEWAYNGYDGHTVTLTALVPLQEARAAIAELIEADKEYDAALALRNDPPNGRARTLHDIEIRWARAICRRAAALRACGGA